MRILYIITCLGPGGAQVQVCNLADEMASLGHEVKIISLRNEISILPKNNIEVIPLGLEKNITTLFSSLLKLKRYINIYKPNVIHSHMIHANLLTRGLRLITKMNFLINTAHSSNEGGRGMMNLYRVSDSLCDLMTNVSQEAVEIYIRKKASASSKIICMYNGVDTNYFHKQKHLNINKEFNLSNDKKVILSIGRLTEAKDYPNLINAFNLLNDKNVYLFIVGVGELEVEIKRMANKSILKDNILFLGERNDIPQLLSFCDVFVLSSKWEGFGLVVAEALSCECNVVATDCGGVKEVLSSYGYLIEKKNSRELSKAIKSSLSVPKGLNIRGREYVVNKFDLKTIAKKWSDIYKEEQKR
ncbi:glycosyltransferase [Photobacterium damselae]|uniref:glycosyltransferase n=1 Tax=Photobacterium damselae TaxID=38293 RepID=UPI001302B91F|nr:glycosyltransferase [Photobacterium damselae]